MSVLVAAVACGLALQIGYVWGRRNGSRDVLDELRPPVKQIAASQVAERRARARFN